MPLVFLARVSFHDVAFWIELFVLTLLLPGFASEFGPRRPR